MKILTSEQIREADAYTIAHEPVSSIDLMERAASACVAWITERFDASFKFNVFCGTGNNGGDGLAIARQLYNRGYDIEIFIVRFSDHCSKDFLVNEVKLKNLDVGLNDITDEKPLPVFNTKTDVIIDAIFGTGLSRPVEGFTARIIHQINKSNVPVIAIDLPSGLFTGDNSSNNIQNIVKASYTLTFQVPKLAFMLPENADFLGEWHILDIGLSEKFISEISTAYFYVDIAFIKTIYRKRTKFSHKGNFGHSLLVAGSQGKMGAAVLASKACMRAGTGLLTVHIPKRGINILQTSIPEAMLDIDSNEKYVSGNIETEKFDAIGIGPGIGLEKETQGLLKLLIQNTSVPLVIDADALNIISENKTWISFLPARSILTPHPKEFERLAGKTSNSFEGLQKLKELAVKWGVYIVLKGANTAIVGPDGIIYFNSTGNPGMATAGSGDALTGILTALLAQGYSSKEACVLGVYLHGLAGDIAAGELSQEALTASDIIYFLGEAFKKIR